MQPVWVLPYPQPGCPQPCGSPGRVAYPPLTAQSVWLVYPSQPATTTPVATQPPSIFRVADGTEPLNVNYRMEPVDGRIEISDGTLTAPTSVAIELTPGASGPNRISVDVYARLPGIPDPQWLTTCYAVPGQNGTYVIDATNLGRVARAFITLMNSIDTSYSASHLVPSVPVSLHILGDDPNLNTAPATLEGVLTISPHFHQGH